MFSTPNKTGYKQNLLTNDKKGVCRREQETEQETHDTTPRHELSSLEHCLSAG